MQIVKSQRFKEELQNIMEFIAKDSLHHSLEFEQNLNEKIRNLPNFPFKCRKSIKSNDENLRDLIFNGYVIPYKIYEDKILILGIFNQNSWNLY